MNLHIFQRNSREKVRGQVREGQRKNSDRETETDRQTKTPIQEKGWEAMEVTGKLYVVFEGVSNDNVLKFIVMMSIQLFEYSKNHWVNYMACELYLNKAIKNSQGTYLEQIYKNLQDKKFYYQHQSFNINRV